MQRLYREFLDGKTTNYIARIFEQEHIKNWDGRIKWQTTTLESMLRNEKYKGDAILQKSYTVDLGGGSAGAGTAESISRRT